MKRRIITGLITVLVSGILLTGCSMKGSRPMTSQEYEALRTKIADLTVRNLEDQAVSVEALWEDRRVVLVFLRHYG